VQGDAGHSGSQGGGTKNNKKWPTEEEEERHKGLLTPQKVFLNIIAIYLSHNHNISCTELAASTNQPTEQLALHNTSCGQFLTTWVAPRDEVCA
jgi:hypothetical protein